MGCFSTSCIISKFPIFGDDCVGIPIEHSGKGEIGGGVYPSSQWSICGFPIIGNCDTYGNMEYFEKGKYYSLNKLLHGDQLEEDGSKSSGENLWGVWQFRNKHIQNKSVMYVNGLVWNKIVKQYKKSSKANLDWQNERNKGENEWLKYKGLKENRFSFDFMTQSCTKEFVLWCNKNDSQLVMDAMTDLMSLWTAAYDTQTLFQPAHFIGEQCGDWDKQVKWSKFFYETAVKIKKEKNRDR